MTKTIDNINIPCVNVTHITNILSTLYANSINKKIPLKKQPTTFFWGAAGVGKSNGVYQMAEKIAQQTGKKVNVTDVRLILFSPVDLRGLPVADAKKEFAIWLKPQIFDMDSSEDVVNILFLDELSAVPQTVQAAAYQICLDRKIGEHSLPDNCIVVGAGNRVTDRSVSYKMPKALCNRLMHFNIVVDYDSWRVWAINNNILPEIIAFLKLDSEKLWVEPQDPDLAYPSPRSWEFVNTIITTMDEEPKKIHQLIAGCVGCDVAVEFEAFCRGVLKMPDVDKIFAGTCKEYPRSYDVTYALVSALVSSLKNKGDSVLNSELENVCCYVMRLTEDFVMAFMKDITTIENVKAKLMKCYSFQNWLNKNKSFKF